MHGLRCPLGAHYLPLPGPSAPDIQAWLVEIGLAKPTPAGLKWDERQLCHSPQERLFIDGRWQDGLLPDVPRDSATQAQYRLLAKAIADAGQHRLRAADERARRGRPRTPRSTPSPPRNGCARKASSTRWCWPTSTTAAATTTAPAAATVSAWACVHYFASRHGFSAPGDDSQRPRPGADLARRQRAADAGAAPAVRRSRADRPRRVPHRRRPARRHGVGVRAAPRSSAGRAKHVIVATPLFIAAHVLERAAGRARRGREAAAPRAMDGGQPAARRAAAGSRRRAAVVGQRDPRQPVAGLRRRAAPEPRARRRRAAADRVLGLRRHRPQAAAARCRGRTRRS